MTHQSLKKNTIMSLGSLFFQSGYSALLGLAANFILTIMLPPKTFGIYIVTLSVISFLNYCSDIGLAASLVQKKEVSDEDIVSTFTIQQVIIITVILIAVSLSNVIKQAYGLPSDALYLYYALLGGFFLSSLKTIPSILLERKVKFQQIVLVQAVENTLFYIVVSLAALGGMGLHSFTIAVLVRSVVGMIMMYCISPWKIRFGISRVHVRELLSFGLPYQTNTFLALIKDDLLMLYIGRILGLDALGYIGWAKRWGEAPIRMIMDNVSRILFPVFARFQEDRSKVSRMIEYVIRYQTMILIPIYVSAILLLDRVVEIIPKYNKWEPALPLFYLFCISALLSSYSNPFINLFNAIGKVKISFKLMIFWTVASWIITPPLIFLFGPRGYPMTLVLLSMTCIYIYQIAKKHISIHVAHHLIPSLICGLLMALGVLIVKFSIAGIGGLFAAGIVGTLLYVVALRYIFHIRIISEVRLLFTHD